jgi:hypothetical protein
VQADFQHTMTLVISISLAMILGGGTLLLLSYRAFATARKGDIKHIVLLVASLAFIFLCCVALLAFSLLQK